MVLTAVNQKLVLSVCFQKIKEGIKCMEAARRWPKSDAKKDIKRQYLQTQHSTKPQYTQRVLQD